jgi:hypothetical protein
MSPLRPITSRIRSRSPTELPPENTSMSHDAHASNRLLERVDGVLRVENGIGTPPCSWMIVLNVNLLMS